MELQTDYRDDLPGGGWVEFLPWEIVPGERGGSIEIAPGGTSCGMLFPPSVMPALLTALADVLIAGEVMTAGEVRANIEQGITQAGVAS